MAFDGNGDGAACQGGFDMCAHVVRAFEGMDEIGGAVGNQFIEEGLEVMPYVGVGVFVEGERRRGVLQEEVEQARFGQRGQVPQDFVRDQVEAPAPGAQ